MIQRPASTPTGIPVLSGLPLLGSILEFRRNRLQLQERAAELAPLTRFNLLSLPLFSVCDADMAHEILVSKADCFSKGESTSRFLAPLLGKGLLTAEGELHRHHRKLLSPAFAPKRVAAYGVNMVAETQQSIASWADGSRISVIEEMMHMTLAIAGRTLFSADVRRDAAQIDEGLTMAMSAVQEALTSPIQLPYTVPLPRHRKLKRAVAMLDEVVYRLIAERRAEGTDNGDVMSMLLLTRDENGTGLSDVQVRDEVMTMILAGHETTANGLAWAIYELSRNPEVRQRLESEVDTVLQGRPVTVEDLPNLPYTLKVFDETLRLHPPAWITSREVIREVEIGGHTFAPHTIFTINIRGIHRRPEYYPDPERFDPERMEASVKKARPRNRYIPFGAGPRVCIGAHFAVMEAQLLLATMAQHVTFRATSTAKIEPDPLITLRPRGDMPMIVRRRHPQA